MPTKRLSMRPLREILRLHLQSQLSNRAISRAQRVSVGAISKITQKTKQLALNWETVCQLDDVPLSQLFYPRANNQLSNQLVMPDWESVRQELTGKNVTKHLLWEAYTQQYPNSSYSYSQ